MSLKSKYRPIDIYRKVPPAVLGNAPTLDLISVDGDVGFIQPTSGNERFNFGTGSEDVRARMYSPMTNTEVRYLDIIEQSSQRYVVLFQSQPTGISGVNHQKEILLGYFKDGS